MATIARFTGTLTPEQGLEPASCEMERLFFTHQGRRLHKWHHYLAIYDRWFLPYKNRPITLLEIGIAGGGSLELWRKFFGSQVRLIGVDIDPKAKERAPADAEIIIGDQSDPAFLSHLVKIIGEADIIIDDGSHINSHQILTFDALFPILKEGGIYLCEDLHTSYWSEFGGGYPKQGLFARHKPASWMEYVKTMIDDMHAWYATRKNPRSITHLTREISGLHIYDSLVVIEKLRRSEPFHLIVGAPDLG